MPQPVHPGYVTLGGPNSTTASFESKCTPGTYCNPEGVQVLCPAGR